jgi:hypothetical protein
MYIDPKMVAARRAGVGSGWMALVKNVFERGKGQMLDFIIVFFAYNMSAKLQKTKKQKKLLYMYSGLLRWVVAMLPDYNASYNKP